MPARPSSNNIATALVVIASGLRLLRGGRFPRSKGSHSKVLRTATLMLLTVLAFSLSPPSPSYASTLTVCASGCSETTIAAAIAAASAGDIISITDAVHSEAGIVVSKDLTIQGQGATSTAVDGGGSGGSGLSVFSINSGVTATIQDMTIRDGFSADGGGILNGGTLTLSNSTLSGNSSTSPGTASGGGGIFNNGGTVTISYSTLSGNSSPLANGGGIFNAGTLTISNSTLSGNSAGSESGGGSEGGGIYNDFGTGTISFSTISGNSATLFGGGIFNLSDSSGAMTVKNSIVGNSVVGGDCTLAGTGTLTAWEQTWTPTEAAGLPTSPRSLRHNSTWGC
jgi:hypothetical protein